MKIVFSYNKDKDVENIINGTKAVNSKKPTKFQILFTEKYGNNFEKVKIGGVCWTKFECISSKMRHQKRCCP